MRKYVPQWAKRFIRLRQRGARDRRAGFSKRFAKTRIPDRPREEIVLAEIHQPIFFTASSANKVENIKAAIELIEAIAINPGEIFSFWEIIGQPDAKRGFKTGRMIIDGRLQEDVGGGLCQVAGMIYHLALTSGMEIVERHSHTLDLYEEDERHTPLGADAGVVFGYKDLRFENTLPDPVYLAFLVDDDSFGGQLTSTAAFPSYEIVFEREDFDTHRTVRTYRTARANPESPETPPEDLGLSRYFLPGANRPE